MAPFAGPSGPWLTLLAMAWLVSLPTSAAEPSSPADPVVVPFQMRRGHIMVPAKVPITNAAPLSLMLDTGYSMTMLHPDHVAALGLKRTGQVSIVGIAGEAPAAVYEGPPFDFAGAIYKPRRVAAFTEGTGGRSRRRDGILGSGFFRRFVVEIDPRAKRLLLHEPASYRYAGPGEVLPLTFSANTPVVEATVRLPDGSLLKAKFEIDTGCDSSLCLGRHFVQAHHLAPPSLPGDATDDGSSRFGVGGGTRTRDGSLPELQLGKLILKRPSANLFLEGSPVDPPLAGHIGWELLQRYRVIFDYSHQQLILETGDAERGPRRGGD